MPLLRGTVTFARFRLEDGELPRDLRRWLARGLQRGVFEPLDVRGSDEDRAAGFVALEDPDSTDFSGALERGRALFAYRVDTLKVKAAAVRAGLARWSAAFAEEHGRPPARGERATARDQLRHELRQRAEPVTRVCDVSWSLTRGELLVWAASRKAVEEVAAAVEQAFEVKLGPASVGARATRARLPEEALAPTPELVGLGREGVARGEA